MFHAPLPIPFLILILIIVLLFGGKKLPELARGFGEGIREFKKATRNDEPENAESLPKTSSPAKPD